MPPELPAGLDAKGRAARKAALTRSIKIRETQVARWRLYVRDPYLDQAMARLQAEVEELRAQREALDHAQPQREQELAASHLGFSRYPDRDPDRAERNRDLARRAEQLRQQPQTPIEEVPF